MLISQYTENLKVFFANLFLYSLRQLIMGMLEILIH
jgi:hypothetical protein